MPRPTGNSSAAGAALNPGVHPHLSRGPVVLGGELAGVFLADDLLEHVAQGQALLAGDAADFDAHLPVLSDGDLKLGLGHESLPASGPGGRGAGSTDPAARIPG